MTRGKNDINNTNGTGSSKKEVMVNFDQIEKEKFNLIKKIY